MENRYGSGWTSDHKNEDFQEEDAIWGMGSVFNGTKDSNSSFISNRIQTAPIIIIPKSSKLSNPNYSSQEPKIVSSAPVNIPDWSKIYGTTSRDYNTSSSKVNSFSWLDDSDIVDINVISDDGFARSSWESDEEEDRNVIPPHEWIARKQTCSFSVCEGAGRTLKGRDLSRVRNAVLTKTGFLESDSSQ